MRKDKGEFVNDMRKIDEEVKRKKILFTTNIIDGLYLFRRELIEKLIVEDYSVYILTPEGEQKYMEYFLKTKTTVIPFNFDRSTTNPIKDIRLFVRYIRTIKRIRPDCVLNYTIKPCIYSGMTCRLLRAPYIETVTGISPALISKNGILSAISTILCRMGFKGASCVFFQNEMNEKLFEIRRIQGKRKKRVQGSGVDLNSFSYKKYPLVERQEICVLYLGRIIKVKGIEELCEAIRRLRKIRPDATVECIFAGSKDENIEIFEEMVASKELTWVGLVDNVQELIKKCHVLILPSYAEGMSNVLLEASACGRPVIASNVPGCKEIVKNGTTGYICEPGDVGSLVAALTRFVNLSYEEKRNMGKCARKYVEKNFDRKTVVEAYLEEIERCLQTKEKK